MTRIIILILLIIGIISCEVKNSRPTNQSNRKSFEEELYITPYKTDTMINDSIRMIVNVIASENDFIEDTFNLFRYIGGSLELEVYNVNYKITSQVIDKEFIYKSLKREVPRDMLISHISRVHASNSKDSIGKILFSVCIPETCACEFFELICLPEGHIKIQEQSDRDH